MLDLTYYPQIERDIQGLANFAQELYKAEAVTFLQKSTKLAGKPNLYERMLPDVESSMATDLAKFKNQLNATAIQLKLVHRKSAMEKFLWGLEGLLLLISMFISGMWYKNPAGNYEPFLVGLGLAIPLIALGIKFGTKK